MKTSSTARLQFSQSKRSATSTEPPLATGRRRPQIVRRLSNLGRHVLIADLLSGAYGVEINLLRPKSTKSSAKNLVKLLHSGSSHGCRMTFFAEHVRVVLDYPPWSPDRTTPHWDQAARLRAVRQARTKRRACLAFSRGIGFDAIVAEDRDPVLAVVERGGRHST
jgi:hypothetical protein